MSEFKVGDRVRVVYVHDTDTYSVGDVGKVVNANFPRVLRVEFENNLSEYAVEEQLELVSEDIQNWWETPEGIEWLSTQQYVEEQFLRFQEKKTYSVGQRFLVAPPSGAAKWYCILAQVESNVVCLINLETGNRINESIRVCDSRKITEEEMKMIARDCSFQFS